MKSLISLTAKVSHPGCLREHAKGVGAGVGAHTDSPWAFGVARSCILGWLRSNEEGVKRRHAVFTLEVHFQLAESS